jgi:methylenetetrahydrofolate reductase (NADPH)
MVKPVYEMDSGLMLYQARHLRDRARIHHTGEEVANQPRPFLGTAINPLSDPIDVPVRRLRLKADCGADFAQTQVLTETRRLAEFMVLARAQSLHRRIFILAGIPVVVSRKALEHLGRVAGVQVDPAFRARLDAASDIRAAGVAEAIALVRAARAIPGIAGVHLMLFGADHRALTDVRADIPLEEPCLSPV